MALDIGNCFHRDHDPSRVVAQARAAEDAGCDEFWLIEDCFFTAGPSLAAAALTSTQSIEVGIGIMATVARNPAITAMECATLAGPMRWRCSPIPRIPSATWPNREPTCWPPASDRSPPSGCDANNRSLN